MKLLPMVMMAITAAMAFPAFAREAEHDYVGVAKCRTCHKKELMGNQVAAWRDGPHHRALETLKNEQSLAIAAERNLGPPHEAAECLSCHVTAHGVPPIRIAHDLDAEDGVQCESCHGPGRDYRKKKIMSDREVAVAKGLQDPAENERVCTACHNENSPTFDPGRYVLPDGTTMGFHFGMAKERILHPIPEDVKGKFVELEKKLKAEGRKVP